MQKLTLLVLILSGMVQTNAQSFPQIEAPKDNIDNAPTGWTMASNTPDMISGNGRWPSPNPTMHFTVYDVSGPSPQGGRMSLLLAEGSLVEAIQTTITGLTAGVEYVVRLYAQGAQLYRDASGTTYIGGSLKVKIDGNVLSTTTYSSSATDTWQLVTVNFTASSATATLTLESNALGATGNNGGMVVVDGGGPGSVVEASSLPVHFSAVGATISNNALSVNWSTASETNNDRFEIEASADGKSFTKIGETASRAINGNSETALNYEFSRSASGITIGLGFGLLALGGIGFNRRKKILATVAIVAGLSFSIVGCQKSDGLVANDENLFVRIGQVDKDGTKKYSQVVKVVRK